MAQKSKPYIRSPRIKAALEKRLIELDMTASEFIRKIQHEFETKHKLTPPAKNHLYKVINGTTIVGESSLFPFIVKSLGLDLETMRQLLIKDKLQTNFGVTKISSPNKSIQDVAALMEGLSTRDQEEILDIVKMKAKH